MAIKGKALAAGVSLLVATLSLILSYVTCDRLLIRYWEWRHDGRRMVFTFWADYPAIALSVLICAVVFWLTFGCFSAEQISLRASDCGCFPNPVWLSAKVLARTGGRGNVIGTDARRHTHDYSLRNGITESQTVDRHDERSTDT
jgi:hypothetical protein